METICGCPPSPDGPLFTKHASDCPRRPLAGLDDFARPRTRTDDRGMLAEMVAPMAIEMARLSGEDPAAIKRRVVEEAARLIDAPEEYLRCKGCANIMPLIGVAEDERCHMCGAEYIIEREHDVNDMENPYRMAERGELAGVEGWLGGRPEPAYSGPGLLGADIDRMARHHHYLGRQEAEAEAAHRERLHQAQLAQAWDEGFNAGLASQWRKLADDFVRRLIADVHFPLTVAEHGPKTKIREALEQVRAGVTGLMGYADELKAAGETPRTPPGERRA